MTVLENSAKNVLKEAYKNNNLCLYLGAGVSIGSGLPSWEKLVLSLFFLKTADQKLKGWRPFPNYLYAISEWYLKNLDEPLEIIARKIQHLFPTGDQGENEFYLSLYRALYGKYLKNNYKENLSIDNGKIIANNPTLEAIAKIISKTIISGKGIKSIITYNYDNLVEIVVNDSKLQPIYDNCSLDDEKIPLYHVHGYIPFDQEKGRSDVKSIIFTEDQYHSLSQDLYSWTNLVQIANLSQSVGLMIGLSLSDRNMRRLLDAIKKTPIRNKNYAILKKPQKERPSLNIVDKIHQKAISILDQFPGGGVKSNQPFQEEVLSKEGGEFNEIIDILLEGGIKSNSRYQVEISGIISAIESLSIEVNEMVLSELGITPIWIEEYADIPIIIDNILT